MNHTASSSHRHTVAILLAAGASAVALLMPGAAGSDAALVPRHGSHVAAIGVYAGTDAARPAKTNGPPWG